MKKLNIQKQFLQLTTICIILFAVNYQSYSQSSVDSTKKKKFMISGSFGLHSFAKDDYYMNYRPFSTTLHSKKAFIKTNFGLLLSKSFIVGIGTGFTYYENYPYKRYIGYHPWYNEDDDEKYNTCITELRRVLDVSLFIRYQKNIFDMLNFFINWENGISYNLTVDNKDARCFIGTIAYDPEDEEEVFRDFKDEEKALYAQLSAGVILNISNTIAIETEIINFKYEALYLDTYTEPFTGSEFKTIFSNPNIGLVFYF